MYHIFVIHSPVEGHLDWFQLFAIVKSCSKHGGAGIFVVGPILEYCRYIPRSGMPGSSGRLILSLLRVSTLLSIMVVQEYIPTSSG